MRVGTAAGLYRRHLLRVLDVRDIKNPHAAKTVWAGPWVPFVLFVAGFRGRQRWKTLGPAIKPSIWHLDRHEEQVSIHRRITLPSWTNQRRRQRYLARVRDIVDVQTIEIALEQACPLK